MSNLTKQGVRDLGGNVRQRQVVPAYKERAFEVDCSPNGGMSGLVLHVEARNVRDAIRQANKILSQANTSFEVVQVRANGKALWWR